MSVLKQTAINASWLVSDRFIRQALNFIVGVLIARQLGPEGFGVLSYGQALMTLLMPIAAFGMPDIVVREFSAAKRHPDTLLATALTLRLILAVGALGLVMATAWVFRGASWTVLAIVLGYGLSYVPQSFDVLESRFQSLDRLGLISTMRMANAFAFSGSRLGALYFHAPIAWFAYLYTIEISMFAALTAYAAHRNGIRVLIGRLDLAEARFLISSSFPLMLRLLATAIYMRSDQIIIQHFLGDDQMGIYSAAVRITELWYFIPVAIVAGAAPSLTRQYHRDETVYARELQRLMKLMALMAVLPAICLTIGAPYIVQLLYGPAFAAAAPVLAIQAWAGVFVAIGVAASPWFLNTGHLRFGVYQAVAGAATSMLLNLFLIPRFGMIGAAVSVVISYCISAVLMNALFVQTRELFAMQVRALTLR